MKLRRPTCDYLNNFQRASSLYVSGSTEALTYMIYKVAAQGEGCKQWCVSYYPTNNAFKCECQRMESRGLPCAHIIVVLIHLGIEELPECLVLKRWSIGAKDGVDDFDSDGNNCWDTYKSARVASMVGIYKKACKSKGDTIDKYYAERDRMLREVEEDETEKLNNVGVGMSSANNNLETLGNPVCVKTKGSGGASTSSTGLRVKRKQNCSVCKLPGHNKSTCPTRAGNSQAEHEMSRGSGLFEEDDVYYERQDLEADTP
ncbi:Zinc finger, PMZ-type [Sesbania bispinosa]|nr:Zinc finger, PMZ-type [Sesbania bispinosa]